MSTISLPFSNITVDFASSVTFPASSYPTILGKKTVLFATAREKEGLKN